MKQDAAKGVGVGGRGGETGPLPELETQQNIDSIAIQCTNLTNNYAHYQSNERLPTNAQFNS